MSLACQCPLCRALRLAALTIAAGAAVVGLSIMLCGCVNRYNVVEVYGDAPLTIRVNADVEHQITPKLSYK